MLSLATRPDRCDAILTDQRGSSDSDVSCAQALGAFDTKRQGNTT